MVFVNVAKVYRVQIELENVTIPDIIIEDAGIEHALLRIHMRGLFVYFLFQQKCIRFTITGAYLLIGSDL